MCAAFSCFADLALTSPDDYYREGEGSLMQCVLTPADPFLPMTNEQIAEITHQQVCLAERSLSECIHAHQLPANGQRAASCSALSCRLMSAG